jgi:undecaprenyl-diphosphatase
MPSFRTALDEKLLLLINHQWTNSALDRVMAIVSSLDVWMPFLVLGAAVAVWRGDFRVRAFIIVAGLLVAVNDGFVSNALKHLVDRPRPYQSHSNVRIVDLAKAKPRFLAVMKPLKIKHSESELEDVEGRSFPSSHSMNTLAVALAGAVFFGRRSWWLFVAAGLVSYSRIYTGAHWPSDILTSLFLGAGVSLPMLALVNPLWHKAAPRWCPALHAQHPNVF